MTNLIIPLLRLKDDYSEIVGKSIFLTLLPDLVTFTTNIVCPRKRRVQTYVSIYQNIIYDVLVTIISYGHVLFKVLARNPILIDRIVLKI